MGVLESGNLHLYPLCWNPPEPGRPHIPSQIGQPGPVDPRANPGRLQIIFHGHPSTGHISYILPVFNQTDRLPVCCFYSSLLFIFSVCRRWETPKQSVSMKPFYPNASSVQRLTSILSWRAFTPGHVYLKMRMFFFNRSCVDRRRVLYGTNMRRRNIWTNVSTSRHSEWVESLVFFCSVSSIYQIKVY